MSSGGDGLIKFNAAVVARTPSASNLRHRSSLAAAEADAPPASASLPPRRPVSTPKKPPISSSASTSVGDLTPGSKKPSKKRKKASKKTPTRGGPSTDDGTTDNTPTPCGGWRQWRLRWWPRPARQEPGLPVTSPATRSSPTSGDTNKTPLLTDATTNATPTLGGGWRQWQPWWWPRPARSEPGLPISAPEFTTVSYSSI